MRGRWVVLLLCALPACVTSQPAGEARNLPPPPPPRAESTDAPVPPDAEHAPAATPEENAQQAPPEGPGVGNEQSARTDVTPAGQWVYTDEYGWVWIPHAAGYTYIPPDPRVFPEQYVYYPAYGWRWVVAPWVYGYGPAPYWGPLGLGAFAWYSDPWFRVGGYWGWGRYRGWGGYRGWLGPRMWGPRGWAGAPSYYRSGTGGRAHPGRGATAPAPRRR